MKSFPFLLPPVLILLVLVSGCASNESSEGHFSSYIDAQGNLVTIRGEGDDTREDGETDTERVDRKGDEPDSPQEKETRGATPGQEQTAGRAHAGGRSEARHEAADRQGELPDVIHESGYGLEPGRYSLPDEALAHQEMDAAGLEEEAGNKQSVESKAEEFRRRDQDRFVSWVEPDGRTVVQPVDPSLVREQRAQARQAGVETIDHAQEPADRDWLETVTPVQQDCCSHVLQSLPVLERGQERVFSFTERMGQIRVGKEMLQVVGVRLGPEVREVQTFSYKRRGGYVHPHVLVLDEKGVPVLLIHNLFNSRHDSTWFRHAFLAGELEREAEHHYLLFYLPYEGDMDIGFAPESDAELSTSGEVVVRGGG